MISVLLDGRPVRDPVSGVARYCIGVSNALNKNFANELNINVLTQGVKNNNKYLDQIKAEHIPIVGAKYSTAHRYVNVAHEFIPNIISEFYPKNFDIVHETYFGNAAVNGKCKISTIHDLFPIEYPHMFSKRNVQYSKRNLIRQVGCSNKIIAVSEYTKKRILEIVPNSKEDNIIVIGNAIDKNFSTNSINLGRDCIENFCKGNDYAVCIGNIEPRKNIKKLVDAWVILRSMGASCKLVLAGRSVHDVENVIDYAKYKLGDGFVYLGSISESEKWHILENAKFMIFPSLLEGYGIPVIEAYSVKLPCIFSRTSALTELAITDDQLFDPLSTDDIVSAIVRVLSNNKNIIGSIDEAYYFSEKNTWDSISRMTYNLYCSALSAC